MTLAATRSDSARTTWFALVALALRNAAGIKLPPRAYVPANLAVGALLVVMARRTGSTFDSLGLAPGSMARSAQVGTPAGAAAVVALTAGAVMPATRSLFDDERVRAGAGPKELAHQLVLRIPIGTVAFEELAFRGVLLDLLRRHHRPVTAIAIDSALFGLWHVVPSVGAASANGVRGDARLAAVTGSVLFTAAVGGLFSELRLRSGHILAPALLHLACNDTCYALSWWLRSGRGRPCRRC